MNENEKPLSENPLFSPKEWDGMTRFLVVLNVVMLSVIIVGVGILIGGLTRPVWPEIVAKYNWILDYVSQLIERIL